MSNLQLINEGLTLVEQVNSRQLTAAGQTAVAHLLHHTPELNAFLIAQRQAAGDVDHANLVSLFQKLDAHFDDSELRDLCFRLKVDYESLNGAGKRDKARELVTHMQRHGRLTELIAQLAQLRPNVHWQVKSQKAGEAEIVTRLDVAVVLDIIRPSVGNVALYLDDREVGVNFILLRNARPDKLLPVDTSWNGTVKAFAHTMDKVKNTFNGAQVHFFFAAPLTLAFGLGCIWGTVDEAIAYHYEKGTYYPVINISRLLR